jgi:hypothetical protein
MKFIAFVDSNQFDRWGLQYDMAGIAQCDEQPSLVGGDDPDYESKKRSVTDLASR